MYSLKKKKTLGVWCTPIIGLLVGAMILCILVKNFTNSFGIKVSTFHLYHLKIKERQSSSHLTSHTPQGREREKEREEGEKIRSKKEERSIHETKPCLKVFLLSGFMNCPKDWLKIFVFLGQMECKNGQISFLFWFHGPIWKVFWGRGAKI